MFSALGLEVQRLDQAAGPQDGIGVNQDLKGGEKMITKTFLVCKHGLTGQRNK